MYKKQRSAQFSVAQVSLELSNIKDHHKKQVDIMHNFRRLLVAIDLGLVFSFVSVVSAAAVYDVNGDGKEGLAEAIHALQVTAGVVPVTPPGTYTNSIGMIFNLLPAGNFFMGSVASEPGRHSTSEVLHKVTLSRSFYIQTTEVTQGQWLDVTGTKPSYFTTCGLSCPVEQVSWDDAKLFIAALNTSEGRTGCDIAPNTCYSLPTEAQWEYAARAETITAFYNGDITHTSCSPLDGNLDTIGWYCGNAAGKTHPVGLKAPNDWGLYDMSGNVYEWCEDWYETYPTEDDVTDPVGPTSGSNRVIRGGDWVSYAGDARSANRLYGIPVVGYYGLGFRLVLP